MRIKNRDIGVSQPPFIIAEVSANHNGDVEKAKQCIKAAKSSGADAVKIQSYEANTMTIDCDNDDFIVKGGLWDKYSLFELYTEAQTPFSWHPDLFKCAEELDIIIFSTPFDETAVDLLEELNTPAYKIASFEITDIKLIEKVSRTGKPLLISTGMATHCEIDDAVTCAKDNGCKDLLLFHCISSYPAPIVQCNLRSIIKIRDTFDVEVGLSDHTLGNTAAIAATAIGASAIEKHFTLDMEDKGPDSEFSIDPSELKELVQSTRDAWLSLGDGGISRASCEATSTVFRRSLYFVKGLKRGEVITQESVRRIRPGFGLPPKYFDKIIGLTVARDVAPGDRVDKESIIGL